MACDLEEREVSFLHSPTITSLQSAVMGCARLTRAHGLATGPGDGTAWPATLGKGPPEATGHHHYDSVDIFTLKAFLLQVS